MHRLQEFVHRRVHKRRKLRLVGRGVSLENKLERLVHRNVFSVRHFDRGGHMISCREAPLGTVHFEALIITVGGAVTVVDMTESAA